MKQLNFFGQLKSLFAFRKKPPLPAVEKRSVGVNFSRGIASNTAGQDMFVYEPEDILRPILHKIYQAFLSIKYKSNEPNILTARVLQALNQVPNGDQSAYQFWHLVLQRAFEYGCAYIEISMKNGHYNFFCLDETSENVHFENNLSENILRIAPFLDINGEPLSAYSYWGGHIERNLQLARFEGRKYQKLPAGIIKTGAGLIADHYSGGDDLENLYKTSGIARLRNDYQFQAIDNSKGLEHITKAHYEAISILGSYIGVPREMLFAGNNPITHLSRANFTKDILRPYSQCILQPLNAYFAGKIDTIYFDIESYHKANFTEVVKSVVSAVSAGLITPNEARERLGYKPAAQEGADELHMNAAQLAIQQLSSDEKEEEKEKEEM